MSYAGAVQAMITSLKNNARRKKTIFKIDKNDNSAYGHLQNLSEKKATPEQLEIIRKKILAENRRQDIRKIYALGISVFILALMFYLIYHYS